MEHDLAELLRRSQHGWIVEGDLVLDPLVVRSRARGPEHDVFHPIRGGPSRRALALEADAPWDPAIGHDLVGQRHQLVPRLRDRVAGLVELVLRVPDHVLEADVRWDRVVLTV